MAYLLTLVTFVPLVGTILVLLLPRRQEHVAKLVTLGTTLVTFVISLAGVLPASTPTSADYQFVEQRRVDPVARHLLPRRRRRHQPAARAADHLPDAAGAAVRRGRRSSRAEGVRDLHAAPRDRRCSASSCALDLFLFYVFWEAMLIPMYLLIGIWGGPRPDLRGGQVLPLHDGRLAADAGRHPLRSTSSTARHRRLTRSTSRLLLQLRSAAGRRADAGSSWPSRSPSRSRCRCSRSTPGCPTPTWRRPPAGSRDPGRRAPEDGHLRLPALLPAALPAGEPDVRPRGSSRWRSSASSTARWCRDWCSRTSRSSSPTRRVEPPGLRDARALRADPAGHRRAASIQMVNHGARTGALFLLVGMIYERRHTRLIAEFGGLVEGDAARSRAVPDRVPLARSACPA